MSSFSLGVSLKSLGFGVYGLGFTVPFGGVGSGRLFQGFVFGVPFMCSLNGSGFGMLPEGIRSGPLQYTGCCKGCCVGYHISELL